MWCPVLINTHTQFHRWVHFVKEFQKRKNIQAAAGRHHWIVNPTEKLQICSGGGVSPDVLADMLVGSDSSPLPKWLNLSVRKT